MNFSTLSLETQVLLTLLIVYDVGMTIYIFLMWLEDRKRDD